MMLRTIGLISTLVLGLLAAPLPTEAQQSGKVNRIGFLSDGPRMRPNFEVFRQGLRELGYIEGQNIVIEWRLAGRKPDRLAEMAADLVRQKVDVIVACCPLAPGAALKATRTIPIVIVIGANRYVTNLRRPGGNVTGLSSMAPDLVGKQLQLFKEAVPACPGWPSSGSRTIPATPERYSRQKGRLGRLVSSSSTSVYAAPPRFPAPSAGWSPRGLRGS